MNISYRRRASFNGRSCERKGASEKIRRRRGKRERRQGYVDKKVVGQEMRAEK